MASAGTMPTAAERAAQEAVNAIKGRIRGDALQLIADEALPLARLLLTERDENGWYAYTAAARMDAAAVVAHILNALK